MSTIINIIVTTQHNLNDWLCGGLLTEEKKKRASNAMSTFFSTWCHIQIIWVECLLQNKVVYRKSAQGLLITA